MAPAPGARDLAWFLLTDLQDSTRLWDQDRQAMEAALAVHDTRLRDALTASGGRIVKHTGDGMLVVFDHASDAVDAAVTVQRTLAATKWATSEPLEVRIGIHGGRADDPNDGWYRRGDDFVGPVLHRCARLMAAGHGGQTLCSRPVADAVKGCFASDIDLVDVGTHRLRGLSRPEQLFAVRDATLPRTFPALVISSTPSNLPPTHDDFVGRERDAEAIIALIRRHQLVTLTGVGGVGKTRLALHVAEILTDEFLDGVRFVSLASIAEPELVSATVAQVLGVRERAGVALSDLITEALVNQRVLLVLDNCEHLIDGAAQLVQFIVAAGPGPRVLATSRELLDVPGEHGWTVPMLDVPSDDASIEEASLASSVRLLVERASAVRSDFTLDEKNVGDVVELCRRLDGIALAIELAAGRLDAMTPREILDRLDRRFRLLGRSHARDGRHGTLHEAIDWSHELLGVEEKVLFRRLGVFAGGFDVTSAEEVTAGGVVEEFDVADVLGRLVRKSMVVVAQSVRRSRFRLLESLREYAREQLADAAELGVFTDAQADHYVRVVEGLERDLRGPGQAAAFEVLWRELDNVRAAFDTMVRRRDAKRALHFVRITRTFWSEHLPAEGLQRALAALGVADAASPELAGGLADASWFAHVLGREDAEAHASASLEASAAAGIPPDPEALMTLAIGALFAGENETALQHFELARGIARDTEDDYEIAAAATGLSITRAILGDAERALEDGEEAVRIGRELGYDTQIAAALAALGFAYGRTDPARAVALLEESFTVRTETTYSSVGHVVAGHLHVVIGNLPDAFVHFRESLCSFLELHDAVFMPTTLEGVASALCLMDRATDAARLLGVAASARTKLTVPGLEIERELRDVAEALVVAAIGVEGFEAGVAEGRRLTLDEGVGEALEISRAHASR